jgi:hypothetical protein
VPLKKVLILLSKQKKILKMGRGGEKISADVIWGKKYEKAKRKRGKM